MAEDESRPVVREAGAGRNTLLAFLTQIATGVFTAILTLYLVRALGPREFGLFSLAVGIGALLMLPSDFGISGSVSRYVAERYRDTRAVAGLLADGLRLKLLISGFVSIVLIALAGPIAAAYGEPSLAWPIRWMAVAVLGQSLVALYRYTFLAMRNATVGLRIVVGESAVEATASILLVVIAGGAAAASAGRAVGYAFGAFLAMGIALRHFGGAAFARSRPLRETRRALGRYAGALFAIDAAFAASVQMAPLMIGGFFGAREVGLFQAPSRLIVLLQYPGVSLANGVAPRMARSEDHEPETWLLTAALRYLILFQALIVAPVVVWSEPLVDLALGPGYERSAEILRQLAPYVFAAGLGGVLTASVNYLGEARRRVPIAFAEVTLTAVLTAALLPTIGLEGAAWAANVVSVSYVLVHVWIVRTLVEFPLRPLMLATLRGLTAAAAAAGVLLLFGTDDLAAWEWIAGGAGALATFLAVTVALGEISLAELRALPGMIRTRLRR
ncbi:MAG TPA: oligosaccharide flippase family protein [Thermoleophilaceae bacterium]|nr:oligosaccharide flippase family protein [Thermoleophilaceae bacterium]